jgi:hypothetical protein
MGKKIKINSYCIKILPKCNCGKKEKRLKQLLKWHKYQCIRTLRAMFVFEATK